MEVIGDLIDIIMSNLFFVVLIIGAIFNFLKRRAGAEQEESRPSQHSGSDGEKRTQLKDIFQQFEEVFKEDETQHHPQEKPKPVRQPMVESRSNTELLERYEQIKDSKVRREQPAINHRNITEVASVKRTKSNPLSVSKKEAVQGVVWAEILGPPRAKRSFYSQRNSSLK
jgi:hypothetical protein